VADEVVLTADGCSVDPAALEFVPNEWDLVATEEALRIREKLGGVGEVVVATCGGVEDEKVLRRCLAMGADRAIRVEARAQDPLSVAHSLAPVARAERTDLILCGVQSSDSVQAATGTILAELLDLPCAAVVIRVDYDAEARTAVVDRELEGGLIDRMEVDTPAVLTIQTGTNQPRYANLRALKLADQAEIAVLPAPAEAPVAYAVRRLYVPEAGFGAELLEGDAADVARRVVEIVRERLG
jgi:electron transfer flavoprotein beta subunit